MDQGSKFRIDTYLGILFLGLGLLLVSIVALALIFTPMLGGSSGDGSQPLVGAMPGLAAAPAGSADLSLDPGAAPAAVDNSSADGSLKARPLDAEAALAPESLPLVAHSLFQTAGGGSGEAIPVDRPAWQTMRLAIPALELDAPVQPVSAVSKAVGGRPVLQYAVPGEYAVGWHDTSAPPGQPGNTVLNGHNNVHGSVFRELVDVPVGEQIILYDDQRSYVYEIIQRELLEERGQPLKVRALNARWILPTSDERLTIVTCWPNTTNSHRLVVVARPVDGG